MRKRGLCCRPCPSVCTLVYCIHTAEDIVKILSRPGRILTMSGGSQFQGEPHSAGARYTRGMGKNAIFRLKSPFISETVRDRSLIAMEWNVNRKS